MLRLVGDAEEDGYDDEYALEDLEVRAQQVLWQLRSLNNLLPSCGILLLTHMRLGHGLSTLGYGASVQPLPPNPSACDVAFALRDLLATGAGLTVLSAATASVFRPR